MTRWTLRLRGEELGPLTVAQLAARADVEAGAQVRAEGGGPWIELAELAERHPELAACLKARARAAESWAAVEAARKELAALDGTVAEPPPKPRSIPAPIPITPRPRKASPPPESAPEPVFEAPVSEPRATARVGLFVPALICAAALSALGAWFYAHGKAGKPPPPAPPPPAAAPKTSEAALPRDSARSPKARKSRQKPVAPLPMPGEAALEEPTPLPGSSAGPILAPKPKPKSPSTAGLPGYGSDQ
ncbi:MAG: hypothetical protein HYZ75_19265 [Elusimicrobia bacterium]|nr:hypothetical protein [Elusimicrobiota bacterium]